MSETTYSLHIMQDTATHVLPIRDPLVGRVVSEMVRRSEAGYAKYGESLDAQTMHADPIEWLQEMKEELLDGVLYAEKTLQELRK